MEIFNKSHITIASESKNIEEAFNEIAKKAKTLKLITDEKILIQDLMKREKMVSTGVGNNVSIPHAVSSSIIKPGIIFLRFKKPIPWKSIDKKPVKVAIALLIPEKERNDLHMNYLTSIAQGLLDSKFVSTLINEKSKDKLAEAILNHLTNHSNDKDNTQPQKDMVLAITACPTGVAHTFMSAKALEDEAKKRKIVFKAQKNGSQGVVDTLTDEEIKKAKYIILANDIEIDTTRLVGKKIYQTSAKKALHNPADVFNKAEKEATILQTRTNAESFFKGKMNVYKHILTGISFMLPFVVAGGILTAVSFF
jgi:PTS system fructose-specific IIC component